MMQNQTVHRLRRGPDRRIAGVCSGLAEYFAVDALLIRIGFVLLAFTGGFGVLLYLLLWVLMPSGFAAPPFAGPGDEARRRRSGIFAGVALIVIGGVLLVHNLGLTEWVQWGYVWPVGLIVLGLAVLVRRPI